MATQMEPTREHLRRSHNDEDLRSYRQDGLEAWGIVVGVLLILCIRWVPLEWAWPVAIIGAISAIASIAAWFKRKVQASRKWRL
jgi:hypothetical protein